METDYVQLDHGSGGRASAELVAEIFLEAFDNGPLRELNDSALVELEAGAVAISTDSYVVDPIEFPGGDIGSLAVHGTVNDVSMRGARPRYLTAGFILEEGLELEVLRRIVRSMAGAAKAAGVAVVAGDTKVVQRGKADRMYINTAGVGTVRNGVNVAGGNARPGDTVLINGPVGDHGMAVLSVREGLAFESPIESDSAPLNDLVAEVLETSQRVHVLRDPTRGGLATTLNEIAAQSGVGVRLFEESLPVRDSVAGACELLGLDPLYVANEGKVIVVVPEDAADRVLETMRAHPRGAGACRIGEVTGSEPGRVFLRTRLGGHRLLDMLRGEQLPRIC